MCDSDWDGAFIGTLVGAAPGALLLAFGDTEDELMKGFLFLLIGSIGGFWGGLAIDSSICGFPE